MASPMEKCVWSFFQIHPFIIGTDIRRGVHGQTMKHAEKCSYTPVECFELI